MAARAAQFKNQNNDSRSRPLLRASDLEVRSRLRNMNVGVNYKALLGVNWVISQEINSRAVKLISIIHSYQ